MSTQQIAATIRQQITSGVLMSLGARDFRHGDVSPISGAAKLPSLVFTASILPMKKDGTRGSTPRNMTVTVGLNGNDYYDVHVTYPKRGDVYGFEAPEVHYEADDVDVETLPRLLLSLDYDGDTITNPRYA